MTREQAALLTKNELRRHGFTDWKVRINTDVKAYYFGLCDYKSKTIFLNAHHIDQHPNPEVEDTIKHEIAHVFCPGDNHGPEWMRKAIELGARPEPCAAYSLSPAVIDAIRSGASIEVTEEEVVVKKPVVKISRYQEACPDCGKPAKEKFNIVTHDRDGNEIRLITLECFHIIKKIIPKGTAFHELVSNWWREDVKTCKHEWEGNKCAKCSEYKLFDFQVVGARFAEFACASFKGCVISDEMGLGKTVQALALLKFHPEYTPTLYVVKSKIMFQWFKQVIRWLGPEYMPQIIRTSKDYIFPGLKSYIISYDLLRRFDKEKLSVIKPALVIVDECQHISNVDATRTQEVRRLVKNTKVIGLSGTPWKNRGSEFFSILNMVDPIKFWSYEGFCKTWVNYYWEGSRRKEGGIRNPARFKEVVQDIVIRRERRDVMKELPPINRMKLHVQLDQIEQDTYDEATSEFVKWYNEYTMSGEEDKIDTLELLAKMSKMRHLSGLAKIPATLGYIEEWLENEEKSLIIGVHHQDVGKLLVAKCFELFKDTQVLALRAGEDSTPIVDKFNTRQTILIASTLAGGEGVDGLQNTCADLVMHERQWNPANEEQFEGRLLRIGQTSPTVNATYVEGEGTIDAHFDAIVETKRREFHVAMNKGEAPKWNPNDIYKELAQRIVDNWNQKNKGKNKKRKNG